MKICLVRVFWSYLCTLYLKSGILYSDLLYWGFTVIAIVMIIISIKVPNNNNANNYHINDYNKSDVKLLLYPMYYQSLFDYCFQHQHYYWCSISSSGRTLYYTICNWCSKTLMTKFLIASIFMTSGRQRIKGWRKCPSGKFNFFPDLIHVFLHILWFLFSVPLSQITKS